MSSAIKRVVLCANDFGVSEGICRGILALADQERVSAVSCCVETKFWQRLAPELARLPMVAGRLVSVGLTVDLTTVSTQQLHSHLERFRNYFGRLPDFLGSSYYARSHQGIPTQIFDFLQHHFGVALPAIVNTLSLHPQGLKARFWSKTYGKRIPANLIQRGIFTNTDFYGLYDPKDELPYGQHMQKWLARSPARGLIVCHPAIPGYPGPDDSLARARFQQFRFLASDAFPASQVILGVGLMPFSPLIFGNKKTFNL